MGGKGKQALQGGRRRDPPGGIAVGALGDVTGSLYILWLGCLYFAIYLYWVTSVLGCSWGVVAQNQQVRAAGQEMQEAWGVGWGEDLSCTGQSVSS